MKIAGVSGMQMLEPDFWRGRGRYSKSAISRKVKDDSPYRPRPEESTEGRKDGDED